MTHDTARSTTDQRVVTFLPSVSSFSSLVVVYLGSDLSRILGNHSPGRSLVLRWLAACMLFCLAAAAAAAEAPVADDTILRP